MPPASEAGFRGKYGGPGCERHVWCFKVRGPRTGVQGRGGTHGGSMCGGSTHMGYGREGHARALRVGGAFTGVQGDWGGHAAPPVGPPPSWDQRDKAIM